MISALSFSEPFEVLEDTSTASDMTRVFIGPSVPAYESFVLLSTFLKSVSLTDIKVVKDLVGRVGEDNLKSLIGLLK